NIYPNPTKDEIQLSRVLSQINLDKDFTKVMSLEVISSTGNVVLKLKNQEYFDNQFDNYLDISNLSNGVYVLKVNIGTESYYGKFLKVE
ncbi:MAG: T9SS type A sorting domain-containing protein, partial [Candidatus Kapaibacteriota bacterium]